MARFPKAEADIAELASAIVSGLNDYLITTDINEVPKLSLLY